MTVIRPNPLNLTMPPAPFNSSGGIQPILDDNGSVGVRATLVGLLVPHIICTAFILARVASRVVLLRKWFVDDTLIVLAWCFSTAVCIVYSIAALTPGISEASDEVALQNSLVVDDEGRHTGPVHPYIMRSYLGLVFYQVCLCLTKLSILAFYLRMFNSRPRERRLALGTIVFVVLYGIPMLFVSIFQCHPDKGLFFGKEMQCFSFTPLLIASASLHTATDAWLIVMVVPCIARLDLPPRQKIALAVVLSLSVFVIAASLVRLQLSLHRQFRPSDAGISNIIAFFVMTILECDIALMCASAPALRPLVAKLWPKLMGDLKKRRSRQPIIDSVSTADLTSFHGYPWATAGPVVPQRPSRASRANSASRINLATNPPVPPMPPPMPSRPRTPGSLSLKSFWSNKSRSRARIFTGDDRPGILRADTRSESRPLSLAFDEFIEKYTKTADSGAGNLPRRNATSVYAPGECPEGHQARWAESQESFVLGLNDPLSPHRLSPDSVLSGETISASDKDEGPGITKEVEGIDSLVTAAPKEGTSPRTDDESGGSPIKPEIKQEK